MNTGTPTLSNEEVVRVLKSLRAEVATALGRVHENMAALNSTQPLLTSALPDLLVADSDLRQRAAALDAAIGYVESPGADDADSLRVLLAPLLSAAPLPLTGDTAVESH